MSRDKHIHISMTSHDIPPKLQKNDSDEEKIIADKKGLNEEYADKFAKGQ